MPCDTKRKFASQPSQDSNLKGKKRRKLGSNTSKKTKKSIPLNSDSAHDLHFQSISQVQQQQQSIKHDTLDKEFEDLRCPICWEMAYHSHITNPCGHIFCQGCINDWLKIKPTCPTCQQRILSTTYLRPVSNLIEKLVQLKKFGEQICYDINAKSQNAPEIIQSIRLPASSLNFLHNLFQRLRNSRRNSRLNTSNQRSSSELQTPYQMFSHSESSPSSISSPSMSHFETTPNNQERETKDENDMSHSQSSQLNEQNIHPQLQPSSYILAPAFFINSVQHPNFVPAPFRLAMPHPQFQQSTVNDNRHGHRQHPHSDSNVRSHLDRNLSQQQQQQTWQNTAWAPTVQPVRAPVLFLPAILPPDVSNVLQRGSVLQFHSQLVQPTPTDRMGALRTSPTFVPEAPQTTQTSSLSPSNFTSHLQRPHF